MIINQFLESDTYMSASNDLKCKCKFALFVPLSLSFRNSTQNLICSFLALRCDQEQHQLPNNSSESSLGDNLPRSLSLVFLLCYCRAPGVNSTSLSICCDHIRVFKGLLLVVSPLPYFTYRCIRDVSRPFVAGRRSV